MLDEEVKRYTDLFNKFGDPENILNKLGNDKVPVISTFYEGYKIGLLREYIAVSGIIPTIKVFYKKNIDDLINQINSKEDLASKKIIVIENEMTNLEHLSKIKEKYPDKEIIVTYNDELSFIDNAINAASMIDYYKSLIDDSMSPLEKITMAYDLAKSFQYKDYEKPFNLQSRYITKVVNDKYIVCGGFISVFNGLLLELGFSPLHLSIVSKGPDGDIKHSRSLVYINDKKYGIDGLFVFDPTYDSASHKYYVNMDNSKIKVSKVEGDGFKETDVFSLYENFLVPIRCYSRKYPNSFDEEASFMNGREVKDESIRQLLHEYQHNKVYQVISDRSFVELLYNVRLKEGYSREIIPKSIQESLLISFSKPYTLRAIEEVVGEMEKNNEEQKESIDNTNNR